MEGIKQSLPNLHELDVMEELVDPSIDYSRPIGEYPTIDTITGHLRSEKQPRHIYTDDLNVNGVLVQDAMEKYLSNTGLSSSMLKEALKTPMHLKFSLDGDKRELQKIQGEKPYFNIGTYLHQCILEPTKFSRAVIEPKLSLTSKEGAQGLISFWENLITESNEAVNEKGEEISPQEAFDLAMEDVEKLGLSMEKQDGKKAYYRAIKFFSGKEAVSQENHFKIQILKKHYDNYGGGILKRLLRHSKREISCYGKDEATGLHMKVRPDALQFKENIGVDAIISVKSTSKEDLSEFFSQSARINYDLSEGMYQSLLSKVTGRDFNTTITVMLQTVAPFAIAVLVWSGEDIEVGKYKFRTALEIASKSIENDSFKGYDAFANPEDMGLIEMRMPDWNKRELTPNY